MSLKICYFSGKLNNFRKKSLRISEAAFNFIDRVTLDLSIFPFLRVVSFNYLRSDFHCFSFAASVNKGPKNETGVSFGADCA